MELVRGTAVCMSLTAAIDIDLIMRSLHLAVLWYGMIVFVCP